MARRAVAPPKQLSVGLFALALNRAVVADPITNEHIRQILVGGQL